MRQSVPKTGAPDPRPMRAESTAAADPFLLFRSRRSHRGGPPGFSDAPLSYRRVAPRPNQLLALSFQSVAFGAGDKSLEPRVTLLERQNGGLTRLAEVRIDRKKARCSNHFDPPHAPADDERAPSFKLDLGAYALSQNSHAIGVRYSCSASWPAEDDDDEFLYLFEPVGKQLRQVLEARIGFSSYERPKFIATSGVGTVTAPPAQGKPGYLDLLLRMKITVENSDPRLYPDTPRTSTSEKTQRFTWDGTRYRELAPSH